MFLRSLLDLLFPRYCAGCGKPLSLGEHFVCPCCVMGLSRVKAHDWTSNERIGHWYEHREVQRVAALVRYQRDSIEAHIIHRLKYGRQWELGRWMGQLAADELRESGLFEGIDLIVPIPLSRQRRWKRGFNQAEQIGQGISLVTHIPMRTDLLERIHNNESQTHFSTEERLKNATDIFRAHHTEELKGKHLLVVDDVMTTGVTMLSAILALKDIENLQITAFAWAWTHFQPSRT